MKTVLEAFTGLFLIQAQPDAKGMWSYRRLPYCSTGRQERSQVFQESNSDHYKNGDPASFHTFMQYLESSSLSANTQTSILSDLKQIGFTNSDQLLEFSRDFVERPESLSTVLQTDFGLSALRSHQLRSTLMRMVKNSTLELQKRKLVHSVHSASDSSTSNSIHSSTPLMLPTSVAIDTIGNLFIVDSSSNTIRKINTNGIIITVAGKNPSYYADFGVPAINASISPTSIAVDYLGNIYIAESGIGRISKNNTNGLLYRLAGYGINYSDGISGLSVHLNFVIGISVDTLGNIFFVEGSNWNQGQKIRLLGTNGIINTIAGLGNFNSDGLYALNVSLNNPYATAFDAAGNLYISEEGANRIRKVAAGVANSSLPLTLTNFSATAINQNIKTIWQTASEQNTSHFNIQNSSDGIAFSKIGTISAVGSGANNYSFIDEHPNYGINYYRLQSMDKDGSFVYSKTVSVTINDKRYFSIVPNPARDFATINFSKPVENTSVRVYDITGKPLMVNAVPRNTTSYKLNVQSLPNGFYIIHVNTPAANYTEKLLINK
jgi:hypothetical protein